jgi:hypothetical protein
MGDGVHGFDFLHGRWDVASRALATRLARCSEWVEFPGTAVCRPFFGGAGNVDEFVFPSRGASGMTLRLFDREREQWFIYWADSRTGELGPPATEATSTATTSKGASRARAFRLVADHARLGALGAVLLPRRRDLGVELDHGAHAHRMSC